VHGFGSGNTKLRSLGRCFLAAPEPPNIAIHSSAIKHMDTAVLTLAIMTATMFAVTFHAWRLGNEKRDVVLLGAVGGLCGVGTAVAAIL
jgi:uncharacterized membrane protein YadS